MKLIDLFKLSDKPLLINVEHNTIVYSVQNVYSFQTKIIKAVKSVGESKQKKSPQICGLYDFSGPDGFCNPLINHSRSKPSEP